MHHIIESPAYVVVQRKCFHNRYQYLYIESICNDTVVLEQNYRYKMMYSPDYAGFDDEQANPFLSASLRLLMPQLEIWQLLVSRHLRAPSYFQHSGCSLCIDNHKKSGRIGKQQLSQSNCHCLHLLSVGWILTTAYLDGLIHICSVVRCWCTAILPLYAAVCQLPRGWYCACSWLLFRIKGSFDTGSDTGFDGASAPVSPLSTGMNLTISYSQAALEDFRDRIRKYEEVYETITNRDLHYIKLIDM